MRNVSQQVKEQFGIKREKGRHKLFIGKPPQDFQPSGPEDFPDRLDAVEVALPRCTIEQGVKAARQHNAGQLQKPPADRRWAVVIHGIDQRKRQDQGRCGVDCQSAEFTPEEVNKLLAACRTAWLPDGVGVSPSAWWRCLITVILTTGLRLDAVLALRQRAICGSGVAPISEILREFLKTPTLTPEALAAIDAMGCGNGPMIFPWPHSRKELYAAARGLTQVAGIEPDTHHSLFHGLRRVYFDRQCQKGGAA